LLTTTNLAVKPWLPIATNSYDTNGNFVLTNAVTRVSPAVLLD